MDKRYINELYPKYKRLDVAWDGVKTSLGSDEQEKGWRQRGRDEGREVVSSEKEHDLFMMGSNNFTEKVAFKSFLEQ